MQRKYYQIYLLLDQQDQWGSRLNRIQRIIQQPDFQYKKEAEADFILGIFLKSSYWLDKELFNESYLYTKKKQNLLPMQRIHLQMVDIGASLLDKGFPLKYDPSEYSESGLNQLGPYVKTFVNQCQQRYTMLYKKLPPQNPIPKRHPKTR